jgi:hypothetical protein
MTFAVVFRDVMDEVPAEIRARLRRSLEEIARVTDRIPPSSETAASFALSPMQLDVNGWRFLYRVELDNARLVVTAAAPAPSDVAVRDSAK